MQLYVYTSSSTPIRPLYYGYYSGFYTVFYENQSIYYMNGSSPEVIIPGNYSAVGAVYDIYKDLIIATNSGIFVLDLLNGSYTSTYIPSLIDIALYIPITGVSSPIVLLLDANGNLYSGIYPYTSFYVIYSMDNAFKIIPYKDDIILAKNYNNLFYLFSLKNNKYIFEASGYGLVYAFGSDVYIVLQRGYNVEYYVNYNLTTSLELYSFQCSLTSIISLPYNTFAYFYPYLYLFSPEFTGIVYGAEITYIGAVAPSYILITYYENGSYYLAGLEYDIQNGFDVYTSFVNVIAGNDIYIYASTTYNYAGFLDVSGIMNGGGIVGDYIGYSPVSSGYASIKYAVNSTLVGSLVIAGFSL